MSLAPLHAAQRLQAWDMDEDLPSLASHAAIELDDLIRNRRTSVDAIQRLATVLSESVIRIARRRSSSLNPTTAVVVNRAISEATGARGESLSDIVVSTDRIAKLLRGAKNTKRRREQLEQLQAFCLALARHASAADRLPHDKPEQSVRC